MSVSEICAKSNYFTAIPCSFNNSIFEYDIRQANINMLKASNYIDDNQYSYLSNVPKNVREVIIGNWIRDNPGLYDIIKDNINESKIQFCKANGIDKESMIVRVANDAIYISSSVPLATRAVTINNHNIEFVEKNHFTSYMVLKKVIIFFCNTPDGWIIDVKGINDSMLYLHQDFLSAICYIIQSRELGGNKIALQEFSKYYNQYVNRSLPTPHYREFNSTSMIRLINGDMIYDSAVNVSYINIDYNIEVLRTLYTYLF